jgi:hypothetical protein
MKDVFEEAVRKQIDRIAGIMEFKSPQQEKAIRILIATNLAQSIHRLRMNYGSEAVLDARNTALFKFTVCLEKSKSEKDFASCIEKSFPEKHKKWYRTLIKRYDHIFLGTIRYPFELSIQLKEPLKADEVKEEVPNIPPPYEPEMIPATVVRKLIGEFKEELYFQKLETEKRFDVVRQDINNIKQMLNKSRWQDGNLEEAVHKFIDKKVLEMGDRIEKKFKRGDDLKQELIDIGAMFTIHEHNSRGEVMIPLGGKKNG